MVTFHRQWREVCFIHFTSLVIPIDLTVDRFILVENHAKCLLLPPATKLRQGNIFTSMCQEFCLGGQGECMAGGGACVVRGCAWQGV